MLITRCWIGGKAFLCEYNIYFSLRIIETLEDRVKNITIYVLNDGPGDADGEI